MMMEGYRTDHGKIWMIGQIYNFWTGKWNLNTLQTSSNIFVFLLSRIATVKSQTLWSRTNLALPPKSNEHGALLDTEEYFHLHTQSASSCKCVNTFHTNHVYKRVISWDLSLGMPAMHVLRQCLNITWLKWIFYVTWQTVFLMCSNSKLKANHRPNPTFSLFWSGVRLRKL